MTQLRDMENAHNEKVSDIAVVTLEKLMKNELEEDLPDDLRMVSAIYSRHFQRKARRPSLEAVISFVYSS